MRRYGSPERAHKWRIVVIPPHSRIEDATKFAVLFAQPRFLAPAPLVSSNCPRALRLVSAITRLLCQRFPNDSYQRRRRKRLLQNQRAWKNVSQIALQI